MLRGNLKFLRLTCSLLLWWSCQTSLGHGVMRHGTGANLETTRAMSVSCLLLGTTSAEKKMRQPDVGWQPMFSGHWWKLGSHLLSSHGSLPREIGWWRIGLLLFAELAGRAAQVTCAPDLGPTSDMEITGVEGNRSDYHDVNKQAPCPASGSWTIKRNGPC